MSMLMVFSPDTNYSYNFKGSKDSGHDFFRQNLNSKSLAVKRDNY